MAKQKMLTAENKKALPALYATEKSENKQAVVKFFNPCGAGTWYAVEASAKLADGSEVALTDKKAKDAIDVLFFGKVCGLGSDELGYFSMNELQSVRLPFGLKIERDMYFDATPIDQCK
jgi:hypothetical protein